MKRSDFTWIASLGCCCELASGIRNHNTSESSIFDWLHITNFDDVCRLIENEFKDATVLDRGIIPDTTQNSLKIKNYNIFVIHYDETQWQEKCNYRIPRFYSHLHNPKARILFVWKSHLYNPVTQDQWDRFKAIVNGINPDLKFYSIVINEFYKKDDVFHVVDNDVFYKVLLPKAPLPDNHPVWSTLCPCTFVGDSPPFWKRLWVEFDEWLAHNVLQKSEK